MSQVYQLAPVKHPQHTPPHYIVQRGCTWQPPAVNYTVQLGQFRILTIVEQQKDVVAWKFMQILYFLYFFFSVVLVYCCHGIIFYAHVHCLNKTEHAGNWLWLCLHSVFWQSLLQEIRIADFGEFNTVFRTFKPLKLNGKCTTFIYEYFVSQNKQRIFPLISSNSWWNVSCFLWGTNLIFKYCLDDLGFQMVYSSDFSYWCAM